jgi:pimeloyl-ACP methyl ester carboxylesterase
MVEVAGVEATFLGLAAPGLGRAGAGGWPCQGMYYRPRGKQPTVALVATHYNVDFSQHYLAEFIAQRGLGFLGWNTRFRGDEPHFLLDHALVDIGVGVRWLREQMGVESIILLGNSGGGSLMAAYQSQATEPNLTPLLDLRLAAGVESLLPCDGFISLAAHSGRPDVLTNWLDPSVVDETDPVSVDESLNLWNPEHGPPYSPEFIVRYRAAQVARNQRITDWAKAEVERLHTAGGSDRLFALPRTWADPRMVDPTLDPSARPPNSCYAGDPKWANYSAWGIGTTNTLRTWLSMWSLETSQCRGEPHLHRLRVPTLVVNAEADTGVFPSDAKAIFDAVAADDKVRVSMPGDHYFLSPAGARDEVADLLVEWTTRHFGDG